MSTIYEDHERLCDALGEHERRVDAYRERLNEECRSLPMGWQWNTVSPVVVIVSLGSVEVSLGHLGSLVIRNATQPQVVPGKVLDAMCKELDKARAAS